MNIKLIYSSSYHPQSQGKIERSHGTWKDKIRFDLITSNSKFGGICDRVTNLPNLQSIYNNAVHSSLGISPYECLLGIKPNSVIQKCNFTNTNIEDIPIEFANESNMTFKPSDDSAERIRQIEKVRSQAFNISEKASANMQKHGLAKFPPSEYIIGDEVYVKFIGKDNRVYRGGASIAVPRVLDGTVIATNKDLHKYKVKYTTKDKTISSDWFRFDMITSEVASQERERQRAKENAKRENTNLQGENERVFEILHELNDIITESRVMTTSYKEALHDKMVGLQQNAAKEDLHVARDIPSDGNYMFHALSLQLSRVRVHISYTRLRHMIVDFLRNNPVLDFSDGTVDFRDFAVIVDGHGYLERMESDGEWGVNTVLVAAACLFRIPIQILSTFECNTCNCLNNTNEIFCHRCEIIHTENQCLFNSSEDIKQSDLNKDHDQKFDFDLDSNTTLGSMLEENFDPDDDNEISVGKPHKGPNDSTDSLHKNDILLSNDHNFDMINKWLQHKLLEFEDQSFGKGILLSRGEESMVFLF
ncbi:unnamed protein product [Mytilus coruscus]|uniref:Integrase catalytic domain-containing protein n=1 Tax=Mytilus coruscus TaxID=42192 RepID=A0A6J8CR59_MYTCO|nr:unnamed protein product [Mytilus coruscus]